MRSARGPLRHSRIKAFAFIAVMAAVTGGCTEAQPEPQLVDETGTVEKWEFRFEATTDSADPATAITLSRDQLEEVGRTVLMSTPSTRRSPTQPRPQLRADLDLDSESSRAFTPHPTSP